MTYKTYTIDTYVDVSDASQMWKFPYESHSLRFELEDAWEQIKPLYEQLHAYVRKKLRDLYGPERISREAPLPAHILGSNDLKKISFVSYFYLFFIGRFYRKHVGSVLGKYFGLNHTVSGKKLFGCHSSNDQTGTLLTQIEKLFHIEIFLLYKNIVFAYSNILKLSYN